MEQIEHCEYASHVCYIKHNIGISLAYIKYIVPAKRIVSDDCKALQKYI